MNEKMQAKLGWCPKCKTHGLRINCTDTTTDGKRRRYVCVNCDFKESRYEISEEKYHEFKKYGSILHQIKKIVAFQKFKN